MGQFLFKYLRWPRQRKMSPFMVKWNKWTHLSHSMAVWMWNKWNGQENWALESVHCLSSSLKSGSVLHSLENLHPGSVYIYIGGGSPSYKNLITVTLLHYLIWVKSVLVHWAAVTKQYRTVWVNLHTSVYMVWRHWNWWSKVLAYLMDEDFFPGLRPPALLLYP